MSLIKKVEIMRLRYEKLMSSFVFKEPTRRIQDNYMLIDQEIKQLQNLIKIKYEKEKTKYSEVVAKLDAYSPLKTIARGYTITKKDGKIIKTQKELKKGDKLQITFIDGEKSAIVE